MWWTYGKSPEPRSRFQRSIVLEAIVDEPVPELDESFTPIGLGGVDEERFEELDSSLRSDDSSARIQALRQLWWARAPGELRAATA